MSLHFFFFFNDTATTEIYTLSLHDALPISFAEKRGSHRQLTVGSVGIDRVVMTEIPQRSEEHTSELQSQSNLVCRLLLEKKKNDAKIFLRVRTYALQRRRLLRSLPTHTAPH